MINKRGEGYIQTCVMIIILCMLLSVFITFAATVNLIRIVKNNSLSVLDSFVIQNSIEIYNSLKNGTDLTESIDTDSYVTMLCEYSTLDNRGNMIYSYDETGNVKYRLTSPRLNFASENRLKITAGYTVYVPLYFAGIKVTEVEVPITVESKYNDKFVEVIG